MGSTFCPGEHVVFVVIKADDLSAGVVLLEHWAEAVPHKGRHERGGPDALFPADVCGLRLVLHGHAPHRDAVRLVSAEELAEILGVGALIGRIQAIWLGGAQHGSNSLHR